MALSKEKAKRWVREQASRFLESYFKESLGSRHPALTILRRLSAQVRTVINEVQRFLVNGSAFVRRKVEPIGRLNYNAGCLCERPIRSVLATF